MIVLEESVSEPDGGTSHDLSQRIVPPLAVVDRGSAELTGQSTRTRQSALIGQEIQMDTTTGEARVVAVAGGRQSK
jgi:hypothetical protein